MSVSPFFLQSSALAAILSNQINLVTDSFYAILCRGAETPSGTMSQYSHIQNEVPLSVNYARQPLASVTTVQSGKRVSWRSGNISFGNNVTLNAKYLFILKGAAGAPQATDMILGWQDLSERAGDIQAITVANPGVVYSNGHTLVNGDTIALMNSDMFDISRTYQTVAGAAANSFQIESTLAALNAGSRGHWVKLNDTSEASSTVSAFQVSCPADGWFVIG